LAVRRDLARIPVRLGVDDRHPEERIEIVLLGGRVQGLRVACGLGLRHPRPREQDGRDERGDQADQGSAPSMRAMSSVLTRSGAAGKQSGALFFGIESAPRVVPNPRGPKEERVKSGGQIALRDRLGALLGGSRLAAGLELLIVPLLL